MKAAHDVTYLPDGGRIATVGGDFTVRLWHANGDAIDVLHGHEFAVNIVAASLDGSRLYTADAGGTVKVWDLQALDPARSVWRLPRACPLGARSE